MTFSRATPERSPGRSRWSRTAPPDWRRSRRSCSPGPDEPSRSGSRARRGAGSPPSRAQAAAPGVCPARGGAGGPPGGMALPAPEAIRVLDAAGHDLVIVETVGVGQAEVDVAAATDTTVVVVSPGWGDAVQGAKAGILEIADVFGVNQPDREG